MKFIQKAGNHMSLRQKEKSEMTHQEIKPPLSGFSWKMDIRIQAFRDIVTESGYSMRLPSITTTKQSAMFWLTSGMNTPLHLSLTLLMR